MGVKAAALPDGSWVGEECCAAGYLLLLYCTSLETLLCKDTSLLGSIDLKD